MTEGPTRRRLILIFSVLSVFYIFSVFYRVCNAVIAPNLVQDLNLNAETLGILGGAFFYAFALVQIPMGPMLDRMGPRIVLTLFPLMGAIGAFLFAVGESFATALLGRILIGMGMSPLLMGALKTFLLRFPTDKFSTLMGSYIAIGNLGNVLGAAPLAYVNATLGWRKTFLLSSLFTFLFVLPLLLYQLIITRCHLLAQCFQSFIPRPAQGWECLAHGEIEPFSLIEQSQAVDRQ